MCHIVNYAYLRIDWKTRREIPSSGMWNIRLTQILCRISTAAPIDRCCRKVIDWGHDCTQTNERRNVHDVSTNIDLTWIYEPFWALPLSRLHDWACQYSESVSFHVTDRSMSMITIVSCWSSASFTTSRKSYWLAPYLPQIQSSKYKANWLTVVIR